MRNEVGGSVGALNARLSSGPIHCRQQWPQGRVVGVFLGSASCPGDWGQRSAGVTCPWGAPPSPGVGAQKVWALSWRGRPRKRWLGEGVRQVRGPLGRQGGREAEYSQASAARASIPLLPALP